MIRMIIQGKIPFSVPFVPDESLDYIGKALESIFQQGDGAFSRTVEEKIEIMYPGYKAFLTPSCTASLEFTMMLLRLKAGDEVIVPSFTFTSVVTAITKFGATPVFADIDKSSGCIDVNDILRKITPRTRAISWVNYAGIDSSSNDLKVIGNNYGIPLIEDAAHNFGVLTEKQIDEPTGEFVTFSFHATKNIQCGEGGALLVKNPGLIEDAFVIRDKGTNRRHFNDGRVSKYSWVGKGSSYLLAEINSSLLLAQLNNFGKIQRERSMLIHKYRNLLLNIGEFGWSILEGAERAAHMFALIAPSNQHREKTIEHLNSLGIGAVSHYEDLASSPAGIKYSKYRNDKIVNSVDFSGRILRLPLYIGLSDKIEFISQELQYHIAKKLI